jgi:selenide,water dikinase
MSALAMVCFPEKEDLAILEQILAGGLSKMVEAGCTVIGGHSIRDPEIKFGYAVTGSIHPDRVLANSGAKVGDALILTKSLGTGVISTGIKRGEAKPEWIEAATRSMTTLNRAAAEVITSPPFQPGVHAATDITGFGLIGHAREMALASNVSLRIDAGQVPALEGALECIRSGFIPGGLNSNIEFAACVAEFPPGFPDDLYKLLFDPQTAGGLFVSVADSEADSLVSALKGVGVPAVRVGEVVDKTKPLISVTT